jgi:FtsH-binding integral membrane protein
LNYQLIKSKEKMLDFTQQTNTRARTQAKSSTYDAGLRDYMQKVFNNMGVALTITGFISFFVSNSPTIINAIYGSPLKWVIMFAPLAFIFFMSAKMNKISAATAKTYLWIFASLMGLSLAPIFLMYTGSSIARAFFISASLFGFMSLYGYTTKKDLTAMGSFMMMGLIGVIIASIVNIFLQSSAIQFALSILTVIVFTGLTAYDVQKIKSLYYQFAGHTEAISKAATMGALTLYMDFINIFLAILRLFGDRR